MGRGKRLFNQLTKEEAHVAIIKDKGRDKVLLEERNACIVYRYYYHAKIKRMRFEKVIDELRNEFFLSSRTITDIIAKQNDAIKQVFNEKPSLRILSYKFKLFRWSEAA